jgi:hypothetical protein
LTAFTALRAVFIIPLARDEVDFFLVEADDAFDFDVAPPLLDDARLADAFRLDDAPERLALDDIDRLVVDDFRADDDAFFVPPRALADDLPPPRFDVEPFDDPPFFDLPDARFAAFLAMRPPFGARILTGNWGLAKRTDRFDSKSAARANVRRDRHGTPGGAGIRGICGPFV